MRCLLSLPLLLLLLVPALADGPTITFRDRERTVKKASLEELARLVPPVTLTVYEPHEKRERRYQALPLEPLLQAVYGANWNEDMELLFRCSDGYQPTVPGSFARAHKGYLAYASQDSLPFRLKTEHEGEVAAGPLYLVWDNLGDPGLQKDDSHYWPYQVEEVALIHFRDQYPRTLLPPGASPSAEKGFEHFKRLCLMCHSINGQGGIQAELNYPLSVTEYWREDMLARWIQDPASIRHGTRMPGLPTTLKDPEGVARDIMNYLKAMAGKKIQP
ncbi:MAG: cytochrome c [Candidatus Eremiobacterota bacterium]